MDIKLFLSTFSIVFLAELGDKTQLTAMALAMRFPWKSIFAGIAAAFLVLNIAAVVVGKILFTIIPLIWIKGGSGFLFLYFGYSSLKNVVPEEESQHKVHAATAFRTAFLMIFFAEMGDKTQLVTASIAAQQDSIFSVLTASTLALWLVSLIGIFLGKKLLQHVPLKYINRSAGVMFLIFGVAALFQAFRV